MSLPYASPETVRDFLEKRPASDPPYIVAVIADQVVGIGSLDCGRGRRAYVGQVGMGVHDAWIGKGIGTALLTALVATADR